MTTEIPPRHIGQAGWETKVIYKRLREAKTGFIVTYQELSDLAKRDVQHSGRSALGSARYMALRDYGIVFGVVVNIGLKRLNDPEKVQGTQAHLNHIGRTAKRGLRVLTAVDDYNALSHELKVEHNVKASILGVFQHISSAPQVKRLEGKVKDAGEKLALEKTLRAFLLPTSGSKEG
jgi:hypothetical protein